MQSRPPLASPGWSILMADIGTQPLCKLRQKGRKCSFPNPSPGEAKPRTGNEMHRAR